MEKKTTIEQNKNALKWLADLEMGTSIRFVLGMPGETPETVRETIDLATYFAELSPKVDPNDTAVNFAQALPGTPLYELARTRGVIGHSLEKEEEYLISVSDRLAADGETTINFTDYPRLLHEKWAFDILNSSRLAYIKKFGIDQYHEVLVKSARGRFIKQIGFGFRSGEKKPSLFFLLRQLYRKKISIGAITTIYPVFFKQFASVLFFMIIINICRKYGFPHTLKMYFDYLKWSINKLLPFLNRNQPFEYISLRKLLKKDYILKIPTDNPAMEILRKGR